MKNCRYKVLDCNSNSAVVYYVPEKQDCGVMVYFEKSMGGWIFSQWEYIWTRGIEYGNQEGKMFWPCYHYEELREAGAYAPALNLKPFYNGSAALSGMKK